ncbi:DUF1801 domain-containing protein [Aureivirga sp. CE67]|uniref:DUF1801 domain-containing protein n=1 Tax=Aureivirga sp. CE67 TaxID=1788983 RepID=UPI0018C9BCD3|nr:DUF1801 domain-containing protein [Aureivirga sp. CE67]
MHKINPNFQTKLQSYPPIFRLKLEYLKKLVLETAEENKEIGKVEMTLKWGEPSFITKNGSTLRMDWKEKNPNQYAMYFQCSTSLVRTFKAVFGEKFTYEGNRAIIFQMDEKIPTEELKECIKATLNYHKVKHLPTLGI